MAGSGNHVTPADARAAQVACDGLDEYLDMDVATRLKVRGLLAAFAADLRYAGYVEGKAAGVAYARRTVLDALEGL